MSITSVRGIVFTGLTALALVACGGEESLGEGGSTTSGGGGVGGGSVEPPPGVPADAYKWPVAWVFKCDNVQVDVVLHGRIDSTPKYYEYYDPQEVTINVGKILQFEPFDIGQNIESGVYPTPDDKFSTLQGARRCLLFEEPGNYPIFSFGAANPMTGMLHVE